MKPWLDGWMPWAIITAANAVVLLPASPFMARMPALGAIAVLAYLLGRRRAERETEELIRLGESLTAEDRARMAEGARDYYAQMRTTGPDHE